MATKKPSKSDESKSDELESVTLASHYAFYGDDGVFFQWQEGHVVTDADHIAMLIERKAPITIKE